MTMLGKDRFGVKLYAANAQPVVPKCHNLPTVVHCRHRQLVDWELFVLDDP